MTQTSSFSTKPSGVDILKDVVSRHTHAEAQYEADWWEANAALDDIRAEIRELWSVIREAKVGLVPSIKEGHDVWKCECFPCSGLRAIWEVETRDGLFATRLGDA